jgi:hypothetical protein
MKRMRMMRKMTTLRFMFGEGRACSVGFETVVVRWVGCGAELGWDGLQASLGVVCDVGGETYS